jgi:hypothetical protein
MLSAAVAAIAIVGLGTADEPSRAARAGNDDPPAKGAPSHAAFVADIRRTIKADDLRLIALANGVLEDPGAARRLEDELDRLQIDAIKADGEYQNATLRRKIAEMALKEYVEGSLPHELIAADAAIAGAQADLSRARDQLERASTEVEKVIAQLQEKKCTFSLEQAESQKKVLIEYTKSKKTEELKSEAKMANSVELRKQAELLIGKGRLEQRQKAATAATVRTDAEKRILALLDRAVPIEEQIQARLRQFQKDADHNDAAEKEVLGLMDQLGSIIDEAEAVKAAADFARVKPRLQRAGSGSSSKAD